MIAAADEMRNWSAASDACDENYDAARVAFAKLAGSDGGADTRGAV